jgi:hypothetical protein
MTLALWLRLCRAVLLSIEFLARRNDLTVGQTIVFGGLPYLAAEQRSGCSLLSGGSLPVTPTLPLVAALPRCGAGYQPLATCETHYGCPLGPVQPGEKPGCSLAASQPGSLKIPRHHELGISAPQVWTPAPRLLRKPAGWYSPDVSVCPERPLGRVLNSTQTTGSRGHTGGHTGDCHWFSLVTGFHSTGLAPRPEKL